METYRLGIDFGTTYCCMGVWKDGGLVIIPNGVGERTTPSVVIFDDPDTIYVGEETLYHLPKDNTVKIYEIKRLLGRYYDQIKDIINDFPYKIIKEPGGDRPMIEMKFGKKCVRYYPENIATLIFKKLIYNAESFLNQKIYKVLITFPADFNDYQKNAVRDAAKQIEGLEVLQVINEPSAAVLAYGFPKKFIRNKFFPFNDYFTLVKSYNNEINQNNQNNQNNLIHPMQEYSTHDTLINSVHSNPYIDDNDNDDNLIQNEDNNNLLRTSLQTVKKDLMKILVFDFGGGTFDVSLIYVYNYKKFETMAYNGDQKLGGSDLDKKLMDYCLNEFCEKNHYLERTISMNYKCMQRLKRACEEAKKYLSINLEEKILIEDFYDSKPLCVNITRSKFELLCKDLFDRLIKPLDKIMIEAKLKSTDIDEIILVGGSSKIPKVKEILKTKFENTPINDRISPDEAVAYGASVYAESIRRDGGDIFKELKFLDITGHSIGIEIENGTVEKIINKGSKYPVKGAKYFHNAYNYQKDFDIKIYEGEGKYPNENQLIGEFVLKNIPQRPQGKVLLKVTVNIDIDQKIKVTANVEEEIKKKIIINKKNKYPEFKNNENLKLSINKLNQEERKIQEIIFEYSRNFTNQKTDKDKYDLINRYNAAVIHYLDFFEKNYKDTSSEKYLFLLEKLFKSYTYFFNTSLKTFLDLNEKAKIKESVESFLKKMSVKAPFRIKQLLKYFKNVKNDIFIERLDIFVFTMELLYNKAKINFTKTEKHYILFAKVLFEECLYISNSFIENDDQAKMDFNLLQKYKEINQDCSKKIKLLSAKSTNEIEKLKIQGKLFNNENKLEKDDLNFLLFNLNLTLKKINSIENLIENEEALETKSFYLANIVKIEIIKGEKNIDFKKLEQYALESISIAEKLKNNCKNKQWFKEIVELRNIILKKIRGYKPAPTAIKIDEDDLDELFLTLLNRGNEELLRYILKNYPYEGYIFTEESIEEYKKNKINFLDDLFKKYSIDENVNLVEVKNTILEYINKMIEIVNKS